MRKIYTSFLALAAIGLAANAQQLPNVGFESNWADATPWDSNNNKTTIGQNPESWYISHTAGMSGTGKAALGSKVSGYESESAVNLKQVTTGMGSLSQNVPAYITLGTPWSTSKASLFGGISNSDGGTWGGMEFTGRPDALSLMYTRQRGSDKPDEKSSVIAYTWKGSWSQANVPANITMGTAQTVTMENRDRCILGKSLDGCQGGDVTNNGGVLIASLEQYITENANSWTTVTYDFDYKTTDTPEMINVIISAGDYFGGASVVGKDNELTVDDVKLIYYSRLKSLSINGTPVEGFNANTYSYSLDTTLPEESEIAATVLGNSGIAKATVTLDAENNQALITVNNAQGADIDGESTHTYTLQFKAPEPPVQHIGIEYNGILSVNMNDGEDPIVDNNANVYIEQKENDTATLRLYDFTFGSIPVGDIVVDVTLSQGKDGVEFNGEVKHMELLDGAIIANVTVTGVDAEGTLTAQISVLWLMEGTDEGETWPIDVTFNGTSTSGEYLTGIEGINADFNTNAPVEYYNLNGMRLNGENLPAGLYIRRQGTEVKKVFVTK